MTHSDNSVRRLLVVRLADLGDLLLAEPALRSLHAAFPDAAIDLLVPPSSAELARLIAPYASVVQFTSVTGGGAMATPRRRSWLNGARMAIRLRRANYDRVVLLHHLTTESGTRKHHALVRATGASFVVGLDNGRGTFLTHRVDDFGFGVRHEVDYSLDVARAAGGLPVDRQPRIEAGSASMSDELPDSFIVAYPATGAYSTARTWPIENYIELAKTRIEQGDSIVVVGGSDARVLGARIKQSVPAVVDVTGRTSLVQLTAVVAHARAVVGGDSFVGHLAAALDRPLVAIFGPSNAGAWSPVSGVRVRVGEPLPLKPAIALESGMPCSPCLYTGFALGRREGCATRSCLSMITPEYVSRALNAVLAAERA